jgi:hypothetical protein
MKDVEALPSGKQVIREFDDSGRLMSESHVYGIIDIGLKRTYPADGTIEELYLVKKRLVSRTRYEKVRVDYPDMPAPDCSLEDLSGELVKGAAREQRAWRTAAKQRQPDAAQARNVDDFCMAMMKKGRCVDAAAWLTSESNNLGELTPAASTRLVSKLQKLGCPAIYACEVDEEEGHGNTGHLVIEFPADAGKRSGVFKELAKLAAKQGFFGDVDDGQQYAYIMLD